MIMEQKIRDEFEEARDEFQALLEIEPYPETEPARRALDRLATIATEMSKDIQEEYPNGEQNGAIAALSLATLVMNIACRAPDDGFLVGMTVSMPAVSVVLEIGQIALNNANAPFHPHEPGTW